MRQYVTSNLPVFFVAIFCAAAGVSLPSSANPIISEFCASNDGNYFDEDGDASDWIEIRNSGVSSINLNGWRLTDDAARLSKWLFPSVSLAPNEIIVVFASSKDRSVAGSELHTNFSLAQSGEYLALVSPSNSINTEFSPSYPAQENGHSFGSSTPSSTMTLVTESASCKVIVPDAAYDASVGTSWRDNTLGFDDSSWTAGTQGVGYERSSGFEGDINLDVESAMYTTNASIYIRVPVNVTANPAAILGLRLRMKYDDGFAAFINGSTPANASAYSPSPLAWNSTTTGGNNPEAAATVFEEFDISDMIPNLVSGSNNILAIQGLNSDHSSSDALFRCELIAQVADSGSTSTGYFDTPTPGSINPDIAYEGFLSDTNFVHGRGIYHSSITETLSCPDLGATLIYTTDGSIPSLSNGTVIPPLDEHTPPIGVISIITTTTLRAIAIKEGHRPTNVDTQTYLFPDDVLTQSGESLPLYTSGTSVWDYEMAPDIVTDPRYSELSDNLLSLPTLSIVMPTDDIWGENGVYRNPTSFGSAWERACSVEIIHPDGSPGYQVDAGLRMQGSGSRRRAIGKKSMRLAFRKEYGDSRFKYPLWGPTGPGEIANLVLRGSYFDSWTFQADSSSVDAITRSNALQFRTHFATIAHERTGSHTIASNWVHLYINGKYWGPYNTHERPDAEFAEYHLGGTEQDYTVIKTGTELVQGNLTKWNELMTLCNPYNASNHASILAMIEPKPFIDYIFMNIWGGNNDWPHNNWYAIRNDSTDSPFSFYVWDPENYVFNTSANLTQVSTASSPGIVYDRLRRDLEFQVNFGDRVHQHMFNNGPYTLSNMQTLWQQVADELEPAMNGESARWGDEHTASSYNTVDHWLPHVAYRKNTYMPTRHDLVLSQLKAVDLYPHTPAPIFSQHGGTIVADFQLSITNPEGDGSVYYTLDGSDPRLIGGALNSSAQLYSSALSLSTSTTVKSRTQSASGEWSALNQAHFTTGEVPSLSNLVISEFNYNPADATTAELSLGFTDKDDFEFIELLNTGSSTLDISTLVFDNSSEGIAFDFSTLTNPLLAPDQRVVLAKNSLAYAARYGNADNLAGNFSGRLSNKGETLTLTQNGIILITFTFSDSYPWPNSADGQGASLVLINPMSNPVHSRPQNWRASGQINGTPETAESLPATPLNPREDTNHNGFPDFIDYLIPSARNNITTTLDVDGYLRIEFTIDPRAEKAQAYVQYSEDLSSWTSASDKLSLLSETYNSDGSVTYRWRASSHHQDRIMQFLRLKVEER